MLSTTNSCMTNKEKSVQFQHSFYLCTAGQSQGEVGVNVVSQLKLQALSVTKMCDHTTFILFSFH